MTTPLLEILDPPKTVHQRFVEQMFAKTICRRCDVELVAEHHTLADCEANQQARARHDAGYLRASQVIKQASEAERAADDIAANCNKAAKAHAHQLRAELRDQINDKTGAYQ